MRCGQMVGRLKMLMTRNGGWWLLRQMWLRYWRMGRISIPSIAHKWGSCPPKERLLREGRGQGVRCGQMAGRLKNANDSQIRLIAFAINAVTLFRIFYLRLRWIFVLKKPALGKGRGRGE